MDDLENLDKRNSRIEGAVSPGVVAPPVGIAGVRSNEPAGARPRVSTDDRPNEPRPAHETKPPSPPQSMRRPDDTGPRRFDDGSVRGEMLDLIARLDDINQHSPVSLDAVLAQARSIGDKLGGVGSEGRQGYRAGVEGGEVAPDSRLWIENWVRGAKQLVAYRFAGLGEPERLQAALAWVDQKAVALEQEMIEQIDAPRKATTDGVLRETLSTIPPAPAASKRLEEM